MKNKRILMAKIAAVHGIKGLVKILPYCEDVSLLESTPVYTSESSSETLKLTLKNPMGKYILAQVDGVNDRNAAEDIKGTDLYITRDALPEIEENDTYYIEDLIGLDVLNETGEQIGKVSAVHNFGAGDLLDIKLSNGGESLIPFNDEYVIAITEDNIQIKPFEAQ